MHWRCLLPWAALLGAVGCVAPGNAPESSEVARFARIAKLKKVRAFRYETTLISGPGWSGGAQQALRAASRSAMAGELRDRGYRRADASPDVLVVVHWKRVVRRKGGAARTAVRIDLAAKLFDAENGKRLWSGRRSDVFGGGRIGRERVAAALEGVADALPRRSASDP